MISQRQRPLPDKTQHWQQTDVHARWRNSNQKFQPARGSTPTPQTEWPLGSAVIKYKFATSSDHKPKFGIFHFYPYMVNLNISMKESSPFFVLGLPPSVELAKTFAATTVFYYFWTKINLGLLPNVDYACGNTWHTRVVPKVMSNKFCEVTYFIIDKPNTPPQST